MAQSTSIGTNTPKAGIRSCWVCFGTDADGIMDWVKPCRCRGTTMWVHHSCLMRWIDEKQKGNSYAKVKCPQCNTFYVLTFPPFNRAASIIQNFDKAICKVSPFAASGVLLGSMYWSAVTYGAITVMQVLGHKEGLEMMEKAEPVVLLVGLPMIPIVLVLGKMIQWDEYLLKLWKRHSYKLILIKNIIRGQTATETTELFTPPQVQPPMTREIKFTRVLCGAMVFPSIATIFGQLLFRNVNSHLKRCILGGFSFVVLKGIMNIYLKHNIHAKLDHRQIQNYEEHEQQEVAESDNDEE